MERKTRTRALSWLLSLALMLSLLPGMSLTAYAGTYGSGVEVLVSNLQTNDVLESGSKVLKGNSLSYIKLTIDNKSPSW